MEISGRIAWITGASSGIGEALAVEMARAGARLILSARRAGKLEAVREKCGPEARGLPLDLAELGALPARAAEAWALFGGVDILVNNAGVSQRSLALETELAVDEAIMRVNYLGPVALTKAVLPRMLERGSGQLVVTSSVLGKYGVQRRSAYAASKHALHGFFDSLRCELSGKNIQITLVCPGWVKTGISRSALEGDGSAHGEMDPGQAGGMDPARFARKMLRAIRKDKDEAAIGGAEAWAVLAKRFVPGILNKILPRIKVV